MTFKKLTPQVQVASALIGLAAAMLPVTAAATGTLAGTDISNTAAVSYELGGTPVTQSSNTVVIRVAETLDVAVVLQSPQQTVAAGDTDAPLVFTVTNTGNGPETFDLSVINNDAGDDFDPVAASPSIYFDTDGSGDFTAADVAYVPGTNDPLIPADGSIVVIVLNDIPAGLNNGDIGRSGLQATAATGSGAPGLLIPGAGENGVDVVVGTSGASALVNGEYIVSDITLATLKSALVIDPFGGDQPVPGATIRYTITVEVTGTGVATAAALRDPIPANTTYTDNSLTLNTNALSDQVDADAGELDSSGPIPAIAVRFGDLAAADGVQTIEFEVVID